MRRQTLLLCAFLLVAAFAMLASVDRHAGAAAFRCPAFAGPQASGTIRHSGLDEVSGVVASRERRVLWIHEDSGNGPFLFAVRKDGRVVQRVEVAGATNRDWEDMALADGALWIGDIGDNRRVRDEIQLYRVPEPGWGATSVGSRKLRFRYPSGAHDAESLIVDRRRGAMFVVTKQASGSAGLFRGSIENPRDGRLRILERVRSVPIAPATGAATSRLGVVIRTYARAWLFRWTSDHRVASALSREPCPVPVGGGESVTYRRADGRFYAIPEGDTPPIRFASVG